MKQIRILILLCVLISGHTWLVMVEADTQQEETFNHQTKEISYWIGELGQGQPGDNNLATKTLIQMGTKVTLYLLEVLQAEPLAFQSQALLSQHWGRLRAAHCLSQLNYGDIVGLLTREIERDPHPTMQHIYAIYLTRHDLKKSIQVLVTNLKEGQLHSSRYHHHSKEH